MYEETANPAGRKSDRKASSVLGSLGEASRTLGEGFRAALGISSERRGSARRRRRRGRRREPTRQPQG